MLVQEDYEELLKFFNKNKVKYCIVGAYALAVHGIQRYSKDFDICVEPGPANAKKVIKALEEFGFKSLKLSPLDFCQEKRIIQLGYEPVRIDLLTSIEGVSFEDIWKKKISSKYGRQKAYYLGKNELIKNKTILNRSQDKVDLEQLSQIKLKK